MNSKEEVVQGEHFRDKIREDNPEFGACGSKGLSKLLSLFPEYNIEPQFGITFVTAIRVATLRKRRV